MSCLNQPRRHTSCRDVLDCKTIISTENGTLFADVRLLRRRFETARDAGQRLRVHNP
jgi:hypothetical protein